MPKIRYSDKAVSVEKLRIITQANAIIDAYRVQGFDLTLRQLYYQFVARDLIPNSQKEYKKLGDVIADGRLAGLIDWAAIVDRTRNLEANSHWDEPSDIIASAASSYRIDRWEDQPYRPEVWIEKDALVGVIDGVCKELDVAYFSCRGYTSLSEMWVAGQRLGRYMRGKPPQSPVILHFGDHDPSGKDMTRDIQDRLSLFLGSEMEVRRLALNMDQIDQYHPPPNPAKVTDSRAAAYIKEFGHESWELDALDPAVLAGLIREEITSLLDEDVWAAATAKETTGRRLLEKTSDQWDHVVGYLEDEAAEEPDDEEDE